MMLLDTCVLLWLAADTTAISARAADLIRNTPEGLFVSAISAFEVGQKASAGKLSLPRPVDAWFAAMLQWHGLHEIPVSGVIAARATLLPAIHRDPFDRLLIATAQEHQLKLLTPDLTIAKYPNLQTFW
jgi:PIN domain nuclease of toxin-antitoxin system